MSCIALCSLRAHYTLIYAQISPHNWFTSESGSPQKWTVQAQRAVFFSFFFFVLLLHLSWFHPSCKRWAAGTHTEPPSMQTGNTTNHSHSGLLIYRSLNVWSRFKNGWVLKRQPTFRTEWISVQASGADAVKDSKPDIQGWVWNSAGRHIAGSSGGCEQSLARFSSKKLGGDKSSHTLQHYWRQSDSSSSQRCLHSKSDNTRRQAPLVVCWLTISSEWTTHTVHLNWHARSS